MKCEKQIDICQNVTCHNNGYCYTEQNIGKCKCFTGYSSDECEIESNAIKLFHNVQLTSTIICVVVFTSFIILIVLNDVWNYFYKKKAKPKSRAKVRPKNNK